ncbi:MAG: hypothetical protein HQL51_07795 [Magnetococcales bacterium]|nr:hypothetical protein [Magnetococcales bacterium]
MLTRTNEQVIIQEKAKIATFKKKYIDACTVFIQASENEISQQERLKKFNALHAIANEYFNYIENFVGSSDLLGARKNDTWTNGFAEDCHSHLNTLLNHYKLIDKFATKIGKTRQEIVQPDTFAYANMQRLVVEYLPEAATKLKIEFEGLRLPIYGFENPIMRRGNTSPTWILVSGYITGAVTLLFFMALVISSIVFGKTIPCDIRFIIVIVLAISTSLSSAFLGGTAAISGALPMRAARENPLKFFATGGIAVFIIVTIVGNYFYVDKECTPVPISVSCPDSYQSEYIQKLRFGFCYPRDGWELDRGAIESHAADVYLRHSLNRDVSIHFHVSLIPSNYADKHDEYTKHTANTWKQLDSNLQLVKSSIAGRDANQFTLKFKDKNGVQRPVEVLHVYLTPDKLLEIITTYFEETPNNIQNILGRVRSSIVIERF